MRYGENFGRVRTTVIITFIRGTSLAGRHGWGPIKGPPDMAAGGGDFLVGMEQVQTRPTLYILVISTRLIWNVIYI